MSTTTIILFTVALIIYWIFLLYKFEIDSKYEVSNINAEELFQKYNPMVAGCFQGGRDILPRDILAVILNLIEKRNIGLEIKSTNDEKKKYNYYISRVPEKENEMDKIEKKIYYWLFSDYNKESIELSSAISKMPLNIMAKPNMEELSQEVKQMLNKIGVNQHKVPKIVKTIDVIILFLVWISIMLHLLNKGYSMDENIRTILVAICMIIFCFPIFYIIMIKVWNLIFKKCINFIDKINIADSKVFKMAIVLFAIFLAIAITSFIQESPDNRYIIVDEALYCIAIIIVATDKKMLNNSPLAIEDYSKLNSLKNNIEEYSLMEEKDLEYIVLWGKYLAYAVSFGNAKKITKGYKDLQDLNISDDFFELKVEVK